MNKSFIKGFICGIIATILMFLFVKIVADAVLKEAELATSRSEQYASQVEA